MGQSLTGLALLPDGAGTGRRELIGSRLADSPANQPSLCFGVTTGGHPVVSACHSSGESVFGGASGISGESSGPLEPSLLPEIGGIAPTDANKTRDP